MDRISAIRNVEDALRAFENGDADLADTERRVAAVLRTYATEFDGDDDVFRAVGDEPVDGQIVVAPSEPVARERMLALSGIDPENRTGSDRETRTGSDDRNGPEGETDTDDRNASDYRNNSSDLTTSNNDAVPEFDIERV